jgi:hypothetical protein
MTIPELSAPRRRTVRLLLGTDAVPMAQQAAQELAASDEAWREVT